jgi:two-component system, LytTR family, response regulator
MSKNKNIRIDVLIVEDEIYAQKELTRLLSNCGYDIHIVNYIDSVDDAIEWINSNPEPDIMFFDIQLSDGSSFEIFNHVTTKSPVIFTTAFDEYAIKAFKVNSIDYLLKPVKQNELDSAIAKFISIAEKGNDNALNIDQIEKLLNINKPAYKSRFISRIGDQFLHIDIEKIAYFKAEDNEVLLVTSDNKQYFIDYPLEQISGLVDPKIYYRVNRKYIINISSIKKINKYFNSRLLLELEPGTTENVLISRVKVPEFLNWIDK